LGATIPDYEPRFASAVGEFWSVREAQASKQVASGKVDAGTRGAVTGGKHFDAIAKLIGDVFTDAGMPFSHHGSGSTRLPGYFRSAKNWDTVVVYGQSIAAIIELKSHVGSFGNNQNNRIEEMIGQGRDVHVAARENLLGAVRPWFAYLMLAEDHPDSRKVVQNRTHEKFPVDEDFRGTNYLDRYRIAFHRLVLEGELDSACLLYSDRAGQLVRYPDDMMTFQAFAAAIHGRVTQLTGMLGEQGPAEIFTNESLDGL
jgi:hypothetical protein